MLFTFALPLFSWSTLPEVCQFYLSFQRIKLAVWQFLSNVALHFPRFSFSFYCFLPSLCFLCSLHTTQGWMLRLSISAFLIFYCLDTVLILHLLCCSLINDSLSFYIMCFFNLQTTSFFCCSFISNILCSAWLIIVVQWICAEWVNIWYDL